MNVVDGGNGNIVPEGYKFVCKKPNLNDCLEYLNKDGHGVVSLSDSSVFLKYKSFDFKYLHLVDKPWIVVRELDYDLKEQLSFVEAIIFAAKHPGSQIKYYNEYEFKSLDDIDSSFESDINYEEHNQRDKYERYSLDKYSDKYWVVRTPKENQ